MVGFVFKPSYVYGRLYWLGGLGGPGAWLRMIPFSLLLLLWCWLFEGGKVYTREKLTRG